MGGSRIRVLCHECGNRNVQLPEEQGDDAQIICSCGALIGTRGQLLDLMKRQEPANER